MKLSFRRACCGFLSVLFVFLLTPSIDAFETEFVYDENLFYGSTEIKGCYMTSIIEDETQNKVAIIKADEKLSGEILIPALAGENSETYLWAECFSLCDKITDIIVPGYVKFVSINAFADCRSLERIVFYSKETFIYDNPDTIIDSAVICAPEDSYAHDYAEKYDRKFEKLDNSQIPGNCGGLNGNCKNEIIEGIYEFTYCPHYNEAKIVSVDKNAIGEIDIPEYVNGMYSVVEIAAEAFKDCSGITKVNIGSNILTIGKNAFSGCSSLAEANILYYNTNIFDSEDTFPTNCKLFSYTELYVGSTTKTYAEKYNREFGAKYSDSLSIDCGGIYGSCFYAGESNGYSYGYCPHYNIGSVTEVNPLLSGDVILPSTFDDIEMINLSYDCLMDCKEITSLVIPETVSDISEIENSFFKDCASLTQVTFLNPNCYIPYIPSDVTICGFVNSTAQRYADENNLKFVPISSDMYDNSSADNEIIINSSERIKVVDKSVFIKSDIILNELLSLSTNITEVTDAEGKQVDVSQKLCSGMVLICKNKNGNITDSITVILPGDNDGNGNISAQDARLALRYSVKLENFSEWQIKASDVADFGGNAITASDARFILRASVGLENTDKWYDENINCLSK